MKSNPAQLYEKGFKAKLLYTELENALRIVTFAEYVIPYMIPPQQCPQKKKLLWLQRFIQISELKETKFTV